MAKSKTVQPVKDDIQYDTVLSLICTEDKFEGICNGLVVPAKCVYESACLLKSGVTGQKAQIQQVTVIKLHVLWTTSCWWRKFQNEEKIRRRMTKT